LGRFALGALGLLDLRRGAISSRFTAYPLDLALDGFRALRDDRAGLTDALGEILADAGFR
jgi:hypothetical protein